MGVLPNSRKKYLKNKLGPLINISYFTGFILDKTGNANIPLFVFSCCQVVGGVMLTTIPLIQRCVTTHEPDCPVKVTVTEVKDTEEGKSMLPGSVTKLSSSMDKLPSKTNGTLMVPTINGNATNGNATKLLNGNASRA